MARARNRDWWIPWSFIGFFLVVLVANGALVFFAYDSWTGIETEDAYRKGLAYNEQLARGEAQARLGWQAAFDFAQTAPNRGRIDLHLADRFGTPIDGALVRARIVRPTHVGHDLEVALAGQGGGRYRLEVTVPLKGQWEVRLLAEHERGSFRLRERIVFR